MEIIIVEPLPHTYILTFHHSHLYMIYSMYVFITENRPPLVGTIYFTKI